MTKASERRNPELEAKGPHRKAGVLVQKVGDEWLLYDPETGSMHVINALAEFVWRLCDGSHSIEAMVDQVAAIYEVPEGADVTRDLGDILQSLTEKGILQCPWA